MAYSILYVDDEAALLEISKLFLEQAGPFTVDTACCAADGLNMLCNGTYSVVVSDYEMPGMNGIEFLQEVRNVYPDLPFIIFTGKGREDVVIEALNHGASYYLQKGGDPVSQFAELAHKIVLAVEKRKTEEQLRLDEQRLEALVDFHEMSDMPFPEFMEYAIEAVTRITGSQYGFIASVNDTEDGLLMYGWSQQSLKDNRIPVLNKDFPLHHTGLWADAVRERRPVIINDFAATPGGSPRVPDGHIPLTRYLGVPLLDSDKAVLLAGVANKQTPFDEADVRQITLLISGLWKIVVQKITEDKLRDAYTKMEESRNRLQGQIHSLLSPSSDAPDLLLTDLISADDLQMIQDAFADACNVSSMITDTNGTPITRLSNGCTVCQHIRSTEMGAENCRRSDCMLGKKAREMMKPTYAACYGIGFVDASAPVCIGGRHIANWLIGQSNPMGVTEDRVAAYAREIGADEDVLLGAFEQMEVMSLDQFEKILHLLWIAAASLSTFVYVNVRLATGALQVEPCGGEPTGGEYKKYPCSGVTCGK
ncbi:PocR ligand-binding domain-containing protein [Methanogenium sp. S4BF]|uniref:PocR ligand-binding domain-containing protein n=1 Tax=Methanogenium sp. S4BF TaxID=1789226 RepID=UPI002416FF0E|nr:PocR ligand-binding domain-containing protein [Methanogenium sp. S4BF]WFN34158.1 PocR ligand-binding domain-containing protein [Methanogenium sp. S4BF]